MRIIGGKHKGRRLNPPKKLPVRPTTDFAKEGLFNLLLHRIELENIDVLDLCAGTGNMSLEFASRGAAKVTAVDENFGCIKFIQKMASELDLKAIQTYKSDLFKFIEKAKGKYDLIFADPPYGLEGSENLADLILEAELLKPDGLFVFEHGREFNFEAHQHCLFSRKYGNVNFTLFQANHS